MTADLLQTTGIILRANLKFIIDCFHFTASSILLQQRRDKKLRKSVKTLLKIGLSDIKTEVGVFILSVRVAPTAMLVDECVESILVGVLLGAHENHMLEKVCHTGHSRRIAPTAHPHCQRCRRFLLAAIAPLALLAIIDEKDLKPIIKA
jgi:hypothetical protein